jgi:hypothetical protein
MHASNIYVGLEMVVHGMMVWIADKCARCKQGLLIAFDQEADAWDPEGTASEWIHAKAFELFPDSPYARRHLKCDANCPSRLVRARSCRPYTSLSLQL